MVSLKLIFALASIPLSAGAGTRGAQVFISRDAILKETEGPGPRNKPPRKTKKEEKAAKEKDQKAQDAKAAGWFTKALEIVREWKACVNNGSVDCTKDFGEHAFVLLVGYHLVDGKGEENLTGDDVEIKGKDEINKFWNRLIKVDQGELSADGSRLCLSKVQCGNANVPPENKWQFLNILLDLEHLSRKYTVSTVIQCKDEENCEVKEQAITDKDLEKNEGELQKYCQTLDTNTEKKTT